MWRSKPISYPGMRRYLNFQLVDLWYLAPDEKKCFYRKWWIYVALLMDIINYIKLTIILCQNEVTDLSYYIGDITLPAGKAKKHLTLIFLAWIIGNIYCTLTLYRSLFTPKLQKWSSIGVVFEHLTNKVHPNSGLPTVLHKHFIRANLQAFYAAGIASILLTLPTILSCPQEFKIYIWIWTGITLISGLVIAGYGANFGPLYCFQVYLFGKQMTDHKKNLIQVLDERRSNNQCKANKLTLMIHREVQTSVDSLKELIEDYRFWIHYNQSIFLATFNAQSIVLYLIFFIEIPRFLRLALIVLGIINWTSGQSVHFFIGTYGQRKIQQHCYKLRQTLYMNISNQMKIRLVTYLEHVESRYFFTIFGSLDYSLHHFIAVVMENTANLLLLISTMGK